MKLVLAIICVGVMLSTSGLLAKSKGAWQSFHKDKDGETFVDVGSVVYLKAGKNRATKVVLNLNQQNDEGFRSILWHIEFECNKKQRWRQTSAAVLYQGEMATGNFRADDRYDDSWKPIFKPFTDARWWACAMAP